MASPTSPRHQQSGRQATTPQASSPLRLRSSPSRLMAALSPSSARRSAPAGSSGGNAPSWDPLYLCDGEVVFATFQVDASIDGGAGIPGQLRVASASLFFSPALAYRPTVRIPLASLAECYEDEDAAPPLLPRSPLLQPPPSSSSSPAPAAPAASAAARTTVLAAECPEHLLIRPRVPFSRVRRHSVFRFCFCGIEEAGEALGWQRRLGPLAAARAGRGGGGGGGGDASSSARAAAADAALASLVRQLQDSTSFSADDLPGGGERGGAGEEKSKRGGGGVALLGRLRRLRRRQKDDEEEEEEKEEEGEESSPPSAIAFERRAHRVTPLVSEPGRAAVTASGDLLFKPAGSGARAGGSGALLFLPAAAIGALVAREWELRDRGLEAFAAPVFDDGYGKEFEAEAVDERGGGGGAEGGRSGSKRRLSFDYRASFSRSSPSDVSPSSSPLASPRPLSASGALSPDAEGGIGGGDRRLSRRRRSSLSGSRASSRRLPRSAPPSVFLAFESKEDRDAAAEALVRGLSSSSSSNPAAGVGGGGNGAKTSPLPALALGPGQARALAAASARSWLSGAVSTYAHLLRLNLLSGRSFHDLGKYPVFPWVLGDYASEELDLGKASGDAGVDGAAGDEKAVASPSSSSSTSPAPHRPLPPPPFRDLSRPVGALGSSNRLREFRERYRDLEQMARAVRAGERESGAAGAATGASGNNARNNTRKKRRRPLFACCAALPATLEDDAEKDSSRPSPPPPPSSQSQSRPAPRVPDDLALEPFLYGCHYSTPGYCAFWLLRQQPQLALRLQGGRFDAPDRLFLSLKGAWESATTAPTDVKELVPQFYWRDASIYLCPAPPPGGGGGGAGAGGRGPSSSSSSLSRADSSSSSSLYAPFGVRSDGRAVGDVELPPWAWNAAKASSPAPSAAAAAAATADALSAALESDAVASALPFWIDLVFGVKSGRGPEALEADNVFHPMTYGEVARAALAELEEEQQQSGGEESSPDAAARRRRAAEALRVQAAEFGRCPEALFDAPHPRVASFPRVKSKPSDSTSTTTTDAVLSKTLEKEGEEKKGPRSWAGALLLRLRGGGGKNKKKEAEKPENAAAAAERQDEGGAEVVVSASSPSFAEDQDAAAAAAAALASRLAAAAKVASHALSDIEEEEEDEDEEEEKKREREKSVEVG